MNVFSYSACIANDIQFLIYNQDSRCMTQNSGVSILGTEGNTFHGQLEDVLEVTYLNDFLVILFKCKWFNTDPSRKRIKIDNNITSINISSKWFKDDQLIRASQPK